MRYRFRRLPWLLLALVLLPPLANANGASEAFTHTTLLLILFLTLADICGVIAERLGVTAGRGEKNLLRGKSEKNRAGFG